MNQRPIIIVDGMNCWIRYFLGNQEMNQSGESFGGPIGFLRMLGNLFRDFCPSQVFVVWEAGGGNKRRKKLLAEYKAGSSKSNVGTGVFEERTGFQKDLLADEQLKAKQLLFLNKVLKHLSIKQIYLRETEGDDVCAYLAKELFGPYSEHKNTQKIIVSNDKDYYQFLVDPSVRIYHAGKKMLINKEIAQEECDGIHMNNFCVAKSVIGDKSDGIDGVPGVGFKSAAKYYPALCNEEELLLESFIKVAKQTFYEASQGKKKIPSVVQNVEENYDIIRRNYKLIYIGHNALTGGQKLIIDKQIAATTVTPNIIEFMKIFAENRVNITQEHEQLFSEARQFLKHN